MSDASISSNQQLRDALQAALEFLPGSPLEPRETTEQPPYPQIITDRLRQIASLIDSRSVMGHWPALMAQPDAEFLRLLSSALMERRPLVHPLLSSSPLEPIRRHSRDCACTSCHYSKKFPQVKPHHATCGCFECNTVKASEPNYNLPPWHLSKRVPGCQCCGCSSLNGDALR